MKKYKTQHKTLSFLVFHIVFVGIGLVFGITPEKVIESYAESDLESGNVLAYYNKNGEIVVLKNGDYYIERGCDGVLTSGEVLDQVFEPTLTEIIAFSAGKPRTDRCWYYFQDEDSCKKNLGKYEEGKSRCWLYFNNYRNYKNASICRKNEKEKQEGPIKIKIIKQEDIKKFFELFPGNDPSSKLLYDRTYERLKGKKIIPQCENNREKKVVDTVINHFQGSHLKYFENFKHTEVQIEALYRAYRNCQDDEIKHFLENLLPVILTEPNRDDIARNIYSLYEACNVCRQANWLQDKKEFFKFKVIDRQGQVKGDEGRFYVLDKMATQTDLEAWQGQHKNEQASITSFATGHFIAKPESGFKDCESNKNKIENNYTRELAPSL